VGRTRVLDVESTALAQLAMPDLLAVRVVGKEGAGCVAAVGSHTSGKEDGE
jgi:hypothetical protein